MMRDQPDRELTPEQKRLGFFIFGGAALLFLAILIIGNLISASDQADSPDPADQYSSCAELDNSYVDLDTAKCIDEDGDVVNYRDTPRGQELGDIPGY